jgi:hypothetical protein
MHPAQHPLPLELGQIPSNRGLRRFQDSAQGIDVHELLTAKQLLDLQLALCGFHGREDSTILNEFESFWWFMLDFLL